LWHGAFLNYGKEMENKKIEALKEEIESLKSQLPAHSIPPTMLQRLDELEEELEKELQDAANNEKDG
jgi:SMC interacting uncharacterized protein involved in chromosome segregation